MPRRKAWNGHPPKTPAEARRQLLDVARACVERLGMSRASLKDVAEGAGVTRQTVYRYFENAEDLFNSAAALASGGFHERMRRSARARGSLAERFVESLVFSVTNIPRDPHLGPLTVTGEHFTLSSALRLSFVQEEMSVLADGGLSLSPTERDELAELLLRLLHSFLFDPGEARTEPQLRAFLQRWLVPMIEARLESVTEGPR